MEQIKKHWMEYVRKDVAKTAADPSAKFKAMAVITILLIMTHSIQKADASVLSCAACVEWAKEKCGYSIAPGTVTSFLYPPLSAILFAGGGVYCAGAGATCAAACLL